MKKQSLTIRVEVENITVSKEGWYSFDYKVWKNGKMYKKGNYDGTWSNQTANAFRKVLNRGYAASSIIGHLFY